MTSTPRTVCMTLSMKRGIDIMSEKLSAKIMSAKPIKKHIVIIQEDSVARKVVVEDNLISHANLSHASVSVQNNNKKNK